MKQVNPIFLHECHKCGVCDEAKFVNAGPHIKQICNNCGFYVKFFDRGLIPDVKEIKLKIWFIVDGNLQAIENMKKECEFIKDLTGVQNKLMYWKLYLKIRENFCL